MPVAPIIIGIIVHFKFHIPCISIHKLLYFNFFTASFCTKFLYAGIATFIIIIIIIIMLLLLLYPVTGPLSPLLHLNQRRSPPLRIQVSVFDIIHTVVLIQYILWK